MNLWQRIMGLIFRRSFRSGVLPFSPGRIYQCTYRSGVPGYIIHDPRPTVFVLSSDQMYTTGLNTHYLGALQYSLANWIISARDSGVPLNGLVIYQLLKKTYPAIPRLSFRLYFTKNLRGRLVSSGMSNVPEPHANQSLAEPWIRKINQTIYNPAVKTPADTKAMAQNIINTSRRTQYNPTPGAPFAQRTQYEPPSLTPPSIPEV